MFDLEGFLWYTSATGFVLHVAQQCTVLRRVHLQIGMVVVCPGVKFSGVVGLVIC